MLQIHVKHLPKKMALVTLRGRLVLGSETDRFRLSIDSLVGADYQLIVIDCNNLEKIDCAGLGELVRTYTEAERLCVDIVLFNLNERLIDLLVLSKLVTVLPLICEQGLELVA